MFGEDACGSGEDGVAFVFAFGACHGSKLSIHSFIRRVDTLLVFAAEWSIVLAVRNLEFFGFEVAGGKFGIVFGLEGWIFATCFDILRDVEANLMASDGVFVENFPVMLVFFHLVRLVFDALRFEPIFGFALVGAELCEVVQTFVEAAFVGVEVAHI